MDCYSLRLKHVLFHQGTSRTLETNYYTVLSLAQKSYAHSLIRTMSTVPMLDLEDSRLGQSANLHLDLLEI